MSPPPCAGMSPKPLACLDSMRAFLNLCAKSGFGSVLNRTHQVPAQFNGSFWFFSFAGFTPRRRSLFSVKFGGLSEFCASPRTRRFHVFPWWPPGVGYLAAAAVLLGLALNA